MNNLNIETSELIDVLPAAYYDYTDAQLLRVITHIVKNARIMANELDASRPDISAQIDTILDGYDVPVVDVNVKQHSEAGTVGNLNVFLDRINNKFMVVDKDSGEVLSQARPMDNEATLKHFKKHLAKVA